MYTTSATTRKLPRHYTPSQTYYSQLTQLQAKTLSYLLPKGCILIQQTKSKPKPSSSTHKPKQQINPYSNAAFETSINNNHSKLTSTHYHHHSSKDKDSILNKIPSKTSSLQPLPTHTKKPPKQEIPQLLKPMLPILQQLKAHKNAWPFLQPVDADFLGIPQYYQIVKQPMDLSKVQTKLKSAKYSTPQQFYRDINLLIKNSYLFNAANQQFLKLTSQFERYFWRIAGPQSKPANDKKLQRQKERQRERQQKQRLKQQKMRQKMMQKQRQRERKLLLQQQQQAQMALKMAKKKKKVIPKDMLQAQNISVQEKQQLANNIHMLSKQHLKGIRQIVFSYERQQQGLQMGSNGQNVSNINNSNTINNQISNLSLSQGSSSLKPSPNTIHEFDIQKIGYRKIRELQKYVRSKLLQMQNTKYSEQMVEKKNEVDLDEMESQWTEEFVE